MKKSDTLTLLAGLVVTGIGWRYGGSQWGVPLAIVAGAAFLLVHSFWNEKPSTPQTTQAQNTTDSFKQTLENVGNSTATANPVAVGKYEEHHHHYPPSTVSESQPNNPRPRLVITNARMAVVGFDPMAGTWREWAGYDEGVVLEVSNSAGAVGVAVGTASDLVINIGATGVSFSRTNIVARAYWLGEEGNEIDLAPGEKREVLLAVRRKDVLSFYENRKERAAIYIGRRRFQVKPILNPVAWTPTVGGVTLDVKVLNSESGTTLLSKVVQVEVGDSGLLVVTAE